MNLRPGQAAGPLLASEEIRMTPMEKSLRAAAAKADEWAEKAENAGRLEDAATLTTLAAAAKARADWVAKREADLPPSVRGDAAPDQTTSCAICRAPGIRGSAGLTLSCSNPACIRYGCPVAATTF